MCEKRAASFYTDPRTGARLWHHLLAMLFIGCAMAAALRALDRATASNALSETHDAVLIELPPVKAGAHPQGDDARTQQAAPDADSASAPPKPVEKAEPPKPAIVEIPKTLPPQLAAPVSAPQAAHEVGGPKEPHAESTDADDAETHRVSAHQITVWQKALMARLQAARHGLLHHQHYDGLAKIAFEIDRDGHLLSEHVAQSSGSVALDATALDLIRLAAPYPAPPLNAGGSQLSFLVPISFKR